MDRAGWGRRTPRGTDCGSRCSDVRGGHMEWLGDEKALLITDKLHIPAFQCMDFYPDGRQQLGGNVDLGLHPLPSGPCPYSAYIPSQMRLAAMPLAERGMRGEQHAKDGGNALHMPPWILFAPWLQGVLHMPCQSLLCIGKWAWFAHSRLPIQHVFRRRVLVRITMLVCERVLHL